MSRSMFLSLRLFRRLGDGVFIANARKMSVAKEHHSEHPSSLYPRLESVDLREELSKENSRDPCKDINFENHAEAFKNKTTWEIVRALTILKLCSVNTLVDNSLEMMRWVDRVCGRRALRFLFKPTFYSQFVGGETPREIQSCVREMAETGVRAMLAATMEEDVGEGGDDKIYDSNCQRILHAIEIATAEDTPSPMVQLKLSGLLPPDVLVIIGNIYKRSNDKLELIKGISRGLEVSSCDIINTFEELDDEKKKALEKAIGRLRNICQEAKRKGVKVLVDAEYTYLNPGFSFLTLAAVNSFNQESPVVWNTYQCYLKDVRNKLDEEMKIILEDLRACFGGKIVRGAYMVQERARAQALELPDPVCENYAATCNNYNSVISYLLEKLQTEGSKCHIMVASHNEDSVKLVLKKISELNIDKQKGNICFGQLYGMCDQVTNPLANAGYVAYKSIPFGTVDEVLPYLARRAVENKSVLEGARKEQMLLNKEMKRRIKRKLMCRCCSGDRSRSTT